MLITMQYLDNPAAVSAFLATFGINVACKTAVKTNDATESVVITGLVCLIKSIPKSPEGMIASFIGVGIVITVKVAFWLWRLTADYREQLMEKIKTYSIYLWKKICDNYEWFWEKIMSLILM